jgi:hypothetical protein
MKMENKPLLQLVNIIYILELEILMKRLKEEFLGDLMFSLQKNKK